MRKLWNFLKADIIVFFVICIAFLFFDNQLFIFHIDWFLCFFFLLLFLLASCILRKLISRTHKSFIKRFNKINAYGGWIYIDSLVGTIVVATALVAIILTYTQTTKSSIVATNRTQALYIAQQTLEYLKHNDRSATTLDLTIPNAHPTIKGITYTVSLVQLDTRVNNDTKVIPVKVTVSWTDSVSQSSSIDLSTYYYLK